MAIVVAYDRLGVGLNMVDTDSSFVPAANFNTSGSPSITQHDYDTVLISQWYNNYQYNLGIFVSQYSGNIYTIESLFAFDGNVNPLISAYGVNINFNIYDDFSGGTLFTNLYSTNDTITGNKYADTIKSGTGNDNIFGMAGNDFLYGESGHDIIRGGVGRDTIDGGLGIDTADYTDKTTGVSLTLNKFSNAYVFVNNVFEDTIKNVENITGGSGADSLNGDANANIIKGNAGNDVIKGDLGKDTLFGGAGADLFLFDTRLASSNTDTIKDLIKGYDKLVLDDDIFAQFTGKRAVGSGNLRLGAYPLDSNDFLIYNTVNDMLYYDADGSGSSHGMLEVVKIELSGAHAPLNTDFIVIG
jgi:Ca2+-binding RTX toxin-like protein